MMIVGGVGVRRVGRQEAILAVIGKEEGSDYECLSFNSRLINFSCNSSKRIRVSRPWTILKMDLLSSSNPSKIMSIRSSWSSGFPRAAS